VNFSENHFGRLSCLAVGVSLVVSTAAWAQLPNPVLNSLFPPGGQAGQSVELTVTGSALTDVTKLVCSRSDIRFEHIEKNRFRATIPKSVRPGLYDLRVLCRNGISSPRTFFVGNRSELLESDPNETLKTAQSASLNVSINGRIEKKGDLDHFQFAAKRGQRVVIECWAERIDSSLRAVLEVFDASGRRLAVNRGYYGIDPLIDFQVPADGNYVVKVFDLVFAGSLDHFYRLDIDTGPRVSFTVPSVIERGKTTRVSCYGWNLQSGKTELAGNLPNDKRRLQELGATKLHKKKKLNQLGRRVVYDRIDVEVTPPAKNEPNPQPIRLRSEQVAVDGFAFHLPKGHTPVFISVTDVPVIPEQSKHQSPATALKVSIPCEVSGQLIAGNEKDWFSFEAKRGEVLWLEAFGDRIGSPVDLDLALLNSTGDKVLLQINDEVKNTGGMRFPSNHLDPAGQFVVPADGRYLIMLRNLMGGLEDDPRRVYRLSIRRQDPGFHLAVVSQRDEPASINVARRGRTIVDVVAYRHRGLTGSIRVRASNLPEGIHCSDIWLGPGVNRAPLVVTADDNAVPFLGNLTLEGFTELIGTRPVRSGTIVRSGLPIGSSRLTSEMPVAVAGEASIRITADGKEKRKHDLFGEMTIRHSPGSVLDVAVHVERHDASHSAPVNLIGVGLPGLIPNQTATIAAGSKKGYISFYLPPTLPPGWYTIAVQAQTTVPKTPNGNNQPGKSVTVFSNTVTFEVKPAAFIVEVDPYAPKKIHRGETIQIKYTAKRTNGFINKIHTEVEAANKVRGLRVRGVTFVGQTESGTLQMIANDDAPLGKQPFLRLFGVGVVEDQPVFHGSCFLEMEVVE